MFNASFKNLQIVSELVSRRVYGQIEDLPNEPSNGRVTAISFVLFAKGDAALDTRGWDIGCDHPDPAKFMVDRLGRETEREREHGPTP